jgi:hypothetical protein
MKKRSRMIYFGFIAILMLSEMVFANIYTLLGPLKKTADLIGVDLEVERARLMLLTVLDFIPGIGAILAVRAYRNADAAHLGGVGVIMASAGILTYGLYQLWFATYLLQWLPSFHQGVGIFYVLLGILTWFVGSDLRKVPSPPNQSMQADQPSVGR